MMMEAMGKGQATTTPTNSARLQFVPQHRHAAANLNYTARLWLALPPTSATHLNFSSLRNVDAMMPTSTTWLDFSSRHNMDAL
jgi:hypothetical protein